MNTIAIEPAGVVLVTGDGRELAVPCLTYIGQDTDGIHVWEAHTPELFDVARGDQLRIDTMPGWTKVVILEVAE
jgi:hypothetical protein